jgi:hypothetical protein
MANYDIGTTVGHLRVVDNRTVGGVSAISATTGDEAYKIADLRTALGASTAHGVGYYSAAKLNQMNKNDMIYALRLINDAAGI